MNYNNFVEHKAQNFIHSLWRQCAATLRQGQEVALFWRHPQISDKADYGCSDF